MSIMSTEQQNRQQSGVTADLIREELMLHAKNFKVSWTGLGQALYVVWNDKLFYAWGYEKFEYYTERELGIKKPTAMKLLKNYFFLEQEEPAYLAKEFAEDRDAAQVPPCDAINVLRLAKRNHELHKDDYRSLRKSVFDKGKDATALRKDLTTMIRERKQVDPDEEREMRNLVAMRKCLNALRSFERDMEVLKLAPADLVEEAKTLMKKIEEEVE
ncbi:MAG: hypothetical protein KAJ18_09430 [Candidatus Omnitrophica bacterium]|nr:hypothetical protein [Candidatus Omnitrophota bacterium]